MSAEGVDFSKDRQWVTYVAIPQGTLWRSKLDGSERMQLTFPPLQIASPRWSPDSKQIAFMARLPANLWQIYLKTCREYERVVDARYLDEIREQAKQFSTKLLSRQSRVAKCAIRNFKRGKNTIKPLTL